MSRKLRLCLAIAAGGLVASLGASAPSRAASGDASASDDTARRAKVAVRVGPRTVTVGELEDRLAEIPPFQAVTFGASRDEIVRAYVDQVIVRDLALGVGAEQRRLDQTLPTQHQLQRTRSTATLRAIRSGDLRSPAQIPAADVAAYYEEHRARFDSPERVNVWRILCATHDEADRVLAAAKKELTIPNWNALARDHSIDKATNFRGGNLGFLAPDGVSNEAGVKVDPTLVKAASDVTDGELVPRPVAEGGGFAVLWRRTTVPATRRALEEASAQIRSTLYRERTEAREKKLIDELRAKHVRDVDADLLAMIVLPPFDAGVSLPRSAPRAPPSER